MAKIDLLTRVNPERRPTQQDVAKLVGVHRATVSLALKNHPSIPEATREKVLQAAATLGYAPDPMLSSLAAYRSRLKAKSYQGTLAWLANNIPPYQWDACTIFKENFEGSKKRASIYGYELEVFDLHAQQVSPARLAGIFRSRNISGILLPPQPRPNTKLDFHFEDFSSVTFGYSLLQPRLNTVGASQFRAMVITMRELHKLGYQRVGFACCSDNDERADHNYLAGYLVESYLHKSKTRIPTQDFSQLDVPSLQKWILKNRIDAVVTGDTRMLKLVEKAGFRCPEDLGVASPNLDSGSDSRLAGVHENARQAGEAAVDFLVGQIQQGIRGIPELPRQIHIEGTWCPGPSVRRMPDSKVRE
jgi:LacI family transcriptional regulator/LacI family repressor for deo operon, udp, cdd, tsx, nupC, and nupG